MAYEPYADTAYYAEVYKGSIVPAEDLEKMLKQASRHIDSLTYNRIVGRGFSDLTPFQRGNIQEVCCMQADFEYQNREIFDMILQDYSINGVSMQFGESWNVTTQKGTLCGDMYMSSCARPDCAAG